ncbi:MAG: alkaline phosphatase family protein [Chloroflexi bacterium]|nr:alkaline phosphatase family protein [Chloroflexota bacterium]
MSDLDRLLARFETGALLRPSPHVPNIVDLAQALVWCARADGAMLAPGARRLADLIGDAEHLIFILADGLGMALLEALPPDTFLATHVVAELRTVFPSSTPTVLTALATGAWPAAHGVTGQWTHLPEIQGTADLLRFAARTGGVSLAKLGVTVEQAFPLPALLSGVRRDTLALFPEAIANSVSATFFSGRHARRGYRALSAVVDVIIERVAAAPAPTYTSLYAPWIDQETHRHGVRHPGVRAAIQDLNREVERLALRLGSRARIVVSADHGLLDTPMLARHWLRPTPDLLNLLRTPPSGDARVMYLHARDGARETLRRRFHDRYGDRFVVITLEEAEAIELFGPGPLAPSTRQRLGDLLVISTGVDVIEYVPAGSIDRVLSIASHHSGLTPAEMRVPLIVL